MSNYLNKAASLSLDGSMLTERSASAEWIESLWNEEQTAKALHLNNKNTLTVWRSTKRHPLPFYKVGRNVLYDPVDVAQFIRSRAVSAQ